MSLAPWQLRLMYILYGGHDLPRWHRQVFHEAMWRDTVQALGAWAVCSSTAVLVAALWILAMGW